jgi:hypothetical protein
MKAKNVFESSKFCYVFCKLSNLLFITIKQDARGEYYAVTTRLDKIRFICGILIGIWNYIDNNTKTEAVESNRTIIFGIAMFIYTKYQLFIPLIVTFENFFYRYEYFNIVKNLQWIDRKVIKSSLSS